MSQAVLSPNLTKEVQWEVSQIADKRFPYVIVKGGLSVNLNHLKKAKMEREQEEGEEIPQMALFPEQAQQDILPDLVDDNDDQFPEVNIDA